MEVYVKSFAAYRTVKKGFALSSALTLDSLDEETSTVTVKGTDINRSNTGDWLVVDGCVYQIQNVKPQTDRVLLTLQPPLDAFSRPLEYTAPDADSTIGSFISAALRDGWVECVDPVYAVPYLDVSSSDTMPFAAPELDASGCFALPDYCRLMRKSYRTRVRFFDAGNRLRCVVDTQPIAARKVSFEDGRSQLQSVDYSKSGIAKLTVLHDIDTGRKDEAGEPIYNRERTVWYLAESGEISQEIPARRASGEWSQIGIRGEADVEAKVIEAFAKNKTSHKLEFWSTIDLAVFDNCEFWVYGELLRSYISYKRKSSTDKRYYYKSGELATTAAEKLKGLRK